MALSDYKINAFSKPVSALGDTPQMSAAELKEWFDSNSTNELKNSVNGIIDETVAELSGKVDKTEGKVLSTNDYTNEEKQKVALAVTQAELDTYATKEELPKWKTLIDTTLTEEQAGVSEIILAIEDVEAFLNARQIRFAMSFPVAEAKAANAFITSVSIADSNHASYNIVFLRGNNRVSSGDARFYTTASLDVFDFKYDDRLTKSFFSLMSLPTPNYSATTNNITSATTHCVGGFPINTIRQYKPYLRITISNVTLEEGTHIFMEVCE